MIATPEEQAHYREEIDYAISMHGHEYVWGRETVADKTKGILLDAPGKIADGLNRIANNPTIIAMNEKAKAMNARMCEEEAKRSVPPNDRDGGRKRRNWQQSSYGGGGLGGGIDLDFGNDHL